jgi:hypothetical protein
MSYNSIVKTSATTKNLSVFSKYGTVFLPQKNILACYNVSVVVVNAAVTILAIPTNMMYFIGWMHRRLTYRPV